jgi:transcriptional regulator with XRE-family HTH domain
MAEVIKLRRAELDMSQQALAERIGVDRRQVRRYEAGEQQPALNVAVLLAQALPIDLNELAGSTPAHRVNLSGDWWASWQTSKDGVEVITAQEIRMVQQGDTIKVETTTRGLSVEEGGYMWRGELRLWDNEVLMGWYVADEGAVRSKGTQYFVLHPHGVSASGRWVGLSYDGKIQTGYAAIGRTEDDVRRLVDELKETHGQPA